MTFFIAFLSLMIFPIKTIKMVHREFGSFLFGEPKKQYSSPTTIDLSVTDPFRFFFMDLEAKRAEHIQYCDNLKDVWNRSSPQQRERLKPIVKKFLAQCQKFNEIAPTHLALRLEDLE